jgi:NAD(P)-dependent dehydrogenase (short-subunit alcohol dehydrogenase family)
MSSPLFEVEDVFPQTTGYAFPGVSNLHSDIYPATNASINPSLLQPEKVVLITGAGRGIGRSIALQYAHASVAALILCARTADQLDEVESMIKCINAQISVKKLIVDVAKEDEVEKCAEAVKAGFGRLDILVNNAGHSAPWVPITESKPTEWWNTFEVNLKGPYLFLQSLLPLLVETAQKHDTVVDVVNMSSIGAHVIVPGASAYQISKLALCRLTEFVNIEYSEKGINAITLHPGGVLTEMGMQEPIIRPCEYFNGLHGRLPWALTTWSSLKRYSRSSWWLYCVVDERKPDMAGW